MQIDRDLQRRFDALRRADRVAAPDFEAIVRRPVARRRPVVLRAALLAAGILLAIAGGRFAMRKPPTEVPSILTWRSPTAALLRTPGQDLLSQTPTLRSSLLRDRTISGDR